MKRKKDARGFWGAGLVVTRILPASVLLGLMVLLAVLLGCQRQVNTSRGMPQAIRPARQMSRLVQNAQYLRQSGRLELAVEELEEARLQKPDNLEILDLLAQCYEELGHFERAQELYEEALSHGHNPALENNRCYSFYLQGRLKEAESCFRQVLDREPDNKTARNNLGLVLCRLGREAEALALWQEALNDAQARQRLGQALAALGREAPPNLAESDSTPADQQTAAASKPAAASVPEPSEPRAYLYSKEESSPTPEAQSAPAPSVPTAAAVQNQNLTTAASAGQSAAETPQQLAAQVSAPAAAAPKDQPMEKKPQQSPEPTAAPKATAQAEPQKALTDSEAKKEPSPAPTATANVGDSTVDSSPILTALDLRETGIELENGNGVQGCARTFRNRLSLEGFNVVGIGNHIDFGLEETIIAYRSEAAPVAKVLAQKFFPEAKLEAEGKTSSRADIRVSLGRDLIDDREPQNQPPEKVAAVESAPAPPPAPVTTTPPEKAATAETIPPVSPAAATDAPNTLAAQILRKVRIELRNGNGIAGQAREMGRILRFAGFKVVNIGNHEDYDLKETVIAYRPEAAEVAEVLSQKFFSGANLKEIDNLPFWMDIRVLMGQDLNPDPGPLAQLTP